VATLVDIVLAPEVISGVLIGVSVLMTIRVILGFTGEAAELRGRLFKVESRLEKLRAELPEKQQRVGELTKAVNAMKPREQRLRDYYDVLMEIKLRVEREEQKREEEQRVKSERDKVRRDLGL
jgi:hypothetical protein